MKIGVLIPDRGDRPELLDQARSMIDGQSLQPDAMIVVNYTPKGSGYDLTQRVRTGYEKLSKMNVDIVVIWENDDFYHHTYLQTIHELFHDGVDLIGFNNTIYYHIGVKRYRKLRHDTHSSLFQTSIRAGLDIRWPDDQEIFLDIELWKNRSLNRELHRFENGCVGIKHGIGKTGGRGHLSKFFAGVADNLYLYDDHNGDYLKAMTGDHFEFYENLLKQLA